MWDAVLMWDKVLMFIVTCGFFYLFWKLTQKEPNRIKYNSKFILFYLVTTVWSTLVCPLFLLRPKNPRNVILGSWLPKYLTYLYRIKWFLRNEKFLTEDRGAVIVSNHQTAMDILGLFQIWDIVGKLSVIAKKELFYAMPFGLAAYLAGIVFIDRSNPKNAYKTLEVTSEVMVKNKTKIWLFPEGTRNKDYTKLLPFKKGAFTMAVNAQVPLIPVVFSPYYFINHKKHLFNKGHVIIQCLEPISTKGMTTEDIPKLIDTVYNKMLETYKELTKEVLSGLPEDYPFTTTG